MLSVGSQGREVSPRSYYRVKCSMGLLEWVESVYNKQTAVCCTPLLRTLNRGDGKMAQRLRVLVAVGEYIGSIHLTVSNSSFGDPTVFSLAKHSNIK